LLLGVRLTVSTPRSRAGQPPACAARVTHRRAALTSTNAYSAGQAALLVHDAKRLLDWSDRTLAMSMLGLNSGVTPLTAVPQNARPQNWHCAAPDAAWKALRAVIPCSSEPEPDFAVFPSMLRVRTTPVRLSS
jgi:hypothetical protein